MKARVPLPDVTRLIHPGSSAYLILHSKSADSQLRPYLKNLKPLLARGAPKQVARLIEKGVNDPKCGVLAVTCLVPGRDGGQISLTVSLGAYPGLFRLVRRELERQVRNGKSSATLRYYRDKPIFRQTEAPPILSLAGCSILRSSSDAVMEALLDRLDGNAELPTALPNPHALGADANSPADYWGWANSWQDVRFDFVLPSEPRRRLSGVKGSLAGAVPDIQKIRDIRFWGTLRGPQIRVRFRPGEETDADALGDALSRWLLQNGSELAIESSRVNVVNGQLEVSLNLGLTEG